MSIIRSILFEPRGLEQRAFVTSFSCVRGYWNQLEFNIATMVYPGVMARYIRVSPYKPAIISHAVSISKAVCGSRNEIWCAIHIDIFSYELKVTKSLSEKLWSPPHTFQNKYH